MFLVVLIMFVFFGCAVESYIPKGAVLIEQVDNKTVVFELRGQIFLLIKSKYRHGDGAMTRLDEWLGGE